MLNVQDLIAILPLNNMYKSYNKVFFTIKVFILKQTYKYNFILLPPGGFDPRSLCAMRLYEANAITNRPFRPTAIIK